ncbi:MAG: hypothetical protein N0C90_13005 [Candidatus Thiodiazotropha endolucinida]|nr:hypothetical protein [Candidatus Thiodiazotropha taylori]MCW4262280.1 hypothetical protein [Candidatus Thiodiazotropha endolucinida]
MNLKEAIDSAIKNTNREDVSGVSISAEYDGTATNWHAVFEEDLNHAIWTDDAEAAVAYYDDPAKLQADIEAGWEDHWTIGHPARERLCG